MKEDGMDKKDLIIKRTFNAPVKKVWEAWTEPELIKCWWGPENFSAPIIKMDFKVGGKYLFCMRSPEGVDYWNTGEIREIDPQKRIVYTDSFSDSEGNIIPALNYGMKGDWLDRLLVTLYFEEAAPDKTTLTLSTSGMPDEDRASAVQGWNGMLDKLENCLKK